MLENPSKQEKEIEMQHNKVESKQVRSLSIQLTPEQKEAIQRFWKETGSVGTTEILIDVVDEKISPASIQVGTAK
jgi:hypothetical protein